MAAVTRLLPRRKTKRNVVPYKFLVDVVMQKRFYQAFRTSCYAALVILVFAWVLCRRLFSLSRAIHLYLASASIFMLIKLTFRAGKPLYPSIASEFTGKLVSRRPYIPLFCYIFSGWCYFKSILVPNMALYSLKHAEPVKLPSGIPPSLALHRTDTWLVLNEEYTYLATFIMVLALSYAIRFVALDLGSFKLRAEESGEGILARIKRRLRMEVRPLLSMWVATSLSLPVVYLLGTRRFLPDIVKYVVVGEDAVVNYSGFRYRYILLPIIVFPLPVLWSFTFEVCMAYLSLGPMYRGKPISDAAPSDKNGSLVDGLKQPMGSLTSLFAWYELLVIAEHDMNRRKSIYSDVDGERVIWEHISSEFQKHMETQCKLLTNKQHHETKQPQNTANGKAHTAPPKPSNYAGPSVTEVLQSGTAGFGYNMLSIREPHIQVHTGDSSKLYRPESAFEKKLASITKALENKSSTRAQNLRKYLVTTAGQAKAWMFSVYNAFLCTQAGSVFRKTVDRTLAMKIQHAQNTAFALRSIARMITKSIDEDELGYVQNTTADILASMDKYATLLEVIIAHPPISTSDLLVKQGKVKPDVSRALSMLGQVNGAFAEVIELFEPYLDNLRVSPSVRARAKRSLVGDLPVAQTAWSVL